METTTWSIPTTPTRDERAVSFQTADASKEKADLMHAIYDRITVAGPKIVGVRLTQASYAHGLALALAEKVELARPTGIQPRGCHKCPHPDRG